jgi:hypothetical protein
MCSCQPGLECVAKSKFYGACLNPRDKASRLGEGWLGRIAKCGDNPKETF